eukprot:14820376-Alexandrium_andersonii.AAC.1
MAVVVAEARHYDRSPAVGDPETRGLGLLQGIVPRLAVGEHGCGHGVRPLAHGRQLDAAAPQPPQPSTEKRATEPSRVLCGALAVRNPSWETLSGRDAQAASVQPPSRGVDHLEEVVRIGHEAHRSRRFAALEASGPKNNLGHCLGGQPHAVAAQTAETTSLGIGQVRIGAPAPALPDCAVLHLQREVFPGEVEAPQVLLHEHAALGHVAVLPRLPHVQGLHFLAGGARQLD